MKYRETDGLPEIGENVPIHDLLLLAEAHGKYDIIHMLSSRRYLISAIKPFVSDGCTCWPDTWKKKDIYPACFWHDVRYWLGGTSVDRLFADGNLMLDILDITKEVGIARMMFTGVRVAGGPFFQREFQWGYPLGSDDD